MKEFIFDSNTTKRWSCRKGDYIFWCRSKGSIMSNSNNPDINDVWQLNDGDSVLLTNRYQDLPSWFQLHPLETSGSLARRMMQKINSGYKPGDINEGPNIWKVKAGDSVVWVGEPRSHIESDNAVLSLITFNNNAVIIGESNLEHGTLLDFGSFDQVNQSKEDLLRCQEGWAAATQLGMPRTISTGKWTIG